MKTENHIINKFPSIRFTFELWRAGSLLELGIKTREWSIKLNKNKIRKAAVGYTDGNKLSVRPKLDCVAVMFFVNNEHFWTHLTKKEFKICFPKLEKY